MSAKLVEDQQSEPDVIVIHLFI